MHDDATTKLKQNLRGAVIERSDANYDEARALYNGMIDKRPRIIARCTRALALGLLRDLCCRAAEQRDLLLLHGGTHA